MKSEVLQMCIRDSREIVHLIVTLAHHLSLKVIAEGIETQAQRAYLQQFGCEFGQGYLYSPPVDHAALERFLACLLYTSRCV